jgi:hypothetical protein
VCVTCISISARALTGRPWNLRLPNISSAEYMLSTCPLARFLTTIHYAEAVLKEW